VVPPAAEVPPAVSTDPDAKSSVAKALESLDRTDVTPTVISLNRPQPASPLPEGLQGKKLGHFELISPIGAGGMAAVIRAKDLQLERIVALKILPVEMAADPENVSRFKSEARAAAKLDHENIARVFFCGEDQGLHFIAFEYVDGIDLRTLLARNGPLTPLQAVQFMLQIAAGLAHAAERGVVHRDIKPSNILITPEGRAKIVDMGLARHVDPVHGGVTQSGMTLGTFDYISPEQALEPRVADIRSDIYSLGCTFYHLLTGQPPVPDGTAAKKVHHHQYVEPIDPRELNPAIPDELAAVLARMMAKEPRDRYQSPEPLIQHLFQVARNLTPSEGADHGTVLFVDAPIPGPPRYSPLLVGLAGIAAVVILAVLFGVGNDRREPRFGPWPGPHPADGSPTSTAAAPVNGAEPPSAGREARARNVTELARLLEQKTESIILTGEEYNLSDLPQGDGPTGLLATADRVKLVGARIDGRPDDRPVLRFGADSRHLPVTEQGGAILSLVAAGGSATAELRHLRFEVGAAEPGTPGHCGVLARGLRRLNIVDCVFDHSGARDNGEDRSVRFEARGGPDAAVLALERCFFSRGPAALEMTNRGLVKAEQCAFGPHASVFVLRNDSVRPAAEGDRPLVELTRCTVLMNEGAVFQVGKNVSGTIHASGCVFGRSSGGESGEAALIRQGPPKGEIRFVGPQGPAQGRNAYYGLVLWDEPSGQAATLAECRRQQLPFLDPGAAELAKAPWRHPKPLAWLEESPAEAFALNTVPAVLRDPPRVDAMLGVEHCTWGETYRTPLPAPENDSTEAAPSAIVVDPGEATDESHRRFKTLANAIQAAKPGETIFIRWNGPLELPPIEPDGADVRLTIQAADGFHPVLRLSPETNRPHAALFSLYQGSLTFKNLAFRLKAGTADKAKRSVVNIIGSGQCAFYNCVATLEESDGGQLALVALATDPDGVADVPAKIRLERCFLRGKGSLLAVRASRPFELEAEETLAALDGSLIAVLANPADAPSSSPAQVTCRRLTTYLSDSLLEIRSGEERKAAGLVPVQVKASECLFVAAGERALVQSFGIDSDTVTKQLLAWEGRGNLYGNYAKMLHVELPGVMTSTMPTMPTDLSQKTWLAFTRETDDSFGRVSASRPPAADRFGKVQPSDLRVKLADMKRPDAAASDFGANLNQLPQGDDE
jgi:hypothetical protein